MTKAPDTVTDALGLLATDGYAAEVQLIDGHLRWRAGDATCTPAEAVVERVYRFEGDSDPGDEMVVLGVRDPKSGTRGALAMAYGPAADTEVMQHLDLDDRRWQETD
jgi:hypothetical protein